MISSNISGQSVFKTTSLNCFSVVINREGFYNLFLVCVTSLESCGAHRPCRDNKVEVNLSELIRTLYSPSYEPTSLKVVTLFIGSLRK